MFPWSYLSTIECLDKGPALIGAGANSLGPALPEQTGHGSFIRQTKPLLVLEPPPPKNHNYMMTV